MSLIKDLKDKLSTSSQTQDDGRHVRSPETQVIKELETSERSILFPLLCALALLATVAVVMMMNIYVYQVQYQGVGLTEQRDDLELQTQQLNDNIQKNQAPQNLARKALSMGMVSQQDPAMIDLNTGNIINVPSPQAKATVDYAALGGIPQVGVNGSTDTNAQATQADTSSDDINSLNGGTIVPPEQKDPTATDTATPTASATTNQPTPQNTGSN
ncbi:MAG: hypothetical protein QM632_03705 [Micrococcaceae bacterium]